MNPQESELLRQVVRTLQRAPEALDDAEAQRALTVLLASRRDAPLLLLQRVLVLETALAQVRAAQAHAGDGAAPAPAVAPAPRPRPSPFLRDAAVIATGVIGGGLVLGALDTLGEALSGDDGLL